MAYMHPYFGYGLYSYIFATLPQSRTVTVLLFYKIQTRGCAEMMNFSFLLVVFFRMDPHDWGGVSKVTVWTYVYRLNLKPFVHPSPHKEVFCLWLECDLFVWTVQLYFLGSDSEITSQMPVHFFIWRQVWVFLCFTVVVCLLRSNFDKSFLPLPLAVWGGKETNLWGRGFSMPVAFLFCSDCFSPHLWSNLWLLATFKDKLECKSVDDCTEMIDIQLLQMCVHLILLIVNLIPIYFSFVVMRKRWWEQKQKRGAGGGQRGCGEGFKSNKD